MFSMATRCPIRLATVDTVASALAEPSRAMKSYGPNTSPATCSWPMGIESGVVFRE